MDKSPAATPSKSAASLRAGSQIEDIVGRVLQLSWFVIATWRQFNKVAVGWNDPHWTAQWIVNLTHSALIVAFSAMAIIMTVIRRPSKAVAGGLEPRVTAIAGAFLILTLPFLPGTSNNINLSFVGLPILMIGLVLSVWCLSWLGRSYAIMAAARELVMSGPYRVVRHPLYASEMLVIVGVVLTSFSLTSVLLGLTILALQLRRTYNEERVLRAVFPEYEDYARRVPRIIPRLSLGQRRLALHPAE